LHQKVDVIFVGANLSKDDVTVQVVEVYAATGKSSSASG
jgi:hypothetical protein